MPATYSLITATTLTSPTATITFSSIPSTYTDLVIHLSGRTTRATTFDYINLRVNNNSSSIYTSTEIYLQTPTTIQAAKQTAGPFGYPEFVNGDTSDVNCFGYMELYFPQYKNTSYPKGINMFANTANSSTRFTDAWAGLANTNTAISLITLGAGSGNWVANSSFYLYGIVNS